LQKSQQVVAPNWEFRHLTDGGGSNAEAGVVQWIDVGDLQPAVPG
jgi:hypothetical protein